MVYYSFSKWQELLYPEVISQAPMYRSNDERRSPGFLKKYIKLITTTGEKGIRYKTISVPGGTVKGTPAYNALSAIYLLHRAGPKPVVINAKPGSILTFPLKAGTVIRNPNVMRQGPGRTRGPKNWVVTKRVYQGSKARSGTYNNPWIYNIYNKNTYMLTNILKANFLAAKSKKTKAGVTTIEIG
jgi:hypothetical protein